MIKLFKFWVGALLLLIVVVGCGPALEVETPIPDVPAEEPATENEGGISPRPTVTNAPPSTDTPPLGYPAGSAPERQPETARDPYPASAETVWVMIPMGIQCEDSQFATLADAVTSLRSAGIIVYQSSVENMMVCQSCSCPTSEHYRAEIAVDYLKTAVNLGWVETE